MISGLFKKIFINLYDQMSEDQKYQIIKIIDNFMFKFSLSQQSGHVIFDCLLEMQVQGKFIAAPEKLQFFAKRHNSWNLA